MKRWRHWATAFILSTTVAGVAMAQTYPDKPIRVIIPSSAGGIIDVLPRALFQKMSESLRQQIVVDNRPGAAGIIGSEMAAKAAPDGYTLLVVATAHAINPGLYPKLPYDTAKDFTPITMVARIPLLLVTHPSLPVNNVRELVALAKAKPGQLFFASAGNGQGSHLAGEMFKSLAGIDLTHVPYKGAAPGLADVLAGQVPIMFSDPVSPMPHIKAGKLKLLAVGTPKRSAAVPDVPTMMEAGVPGYDAYAWLGIIGPAGLPKEIAAKLHEEIIKAMHAPGVKERFFDPSSGFEIIGTNPEQSAAFIRAEIAKWAPVVKASGAKADQ
ncbi:MAG: tripartite tricarboxylate transporter substrate binding protein [Betaproteobacteria bacterium]|nr:MAG: tripartite tricarboxylate transporter substrate binding protein [Betaproteobacteria bacterium]